MHVTGACEVRDIRKNNRAYRLKLNDSERGLVSLAGALISGAPQQFVHASFQIICRSTEILKTLDAGF